MRPGPGFNDGDGGWIATSGNPYAGWNRTDHDEIFDC
jgi:hypothetical protein